MILFVSSSDVKYNAEKEEKAKQEKKQRQLDAVELARQLEEEKKKHGMFFLCNSVTLFMLMICVYILAVTPI